MKAARILVVDDHAESAEVLARLLRHAGHFVTAAPTGADAVAAAASMPTIDAVISNISLPDGDGCELLRLLRERRAGAPRLAIAVTGHGEPECRQRCEQAGYARFLTKPIQVKELLEAVATLQAPTSLGGVPAPTPNPRHVPTDAPRDAAPTAAMARG
jgi:CheY-like chemotaxis protein